MSANPTESPVAVPAQTSVRLDRPIKKFRGRVNEIDLLRFAAAISVVLFHYSFRGSAADGLSTMSYAPLRDAFAYGYLGVNLFFMISGFVILMSAANATPTSFIASRVARLYPTFWVACTLTYVLISLWAVPGVHINFLQYLGNMTMLGAFLGIPSVDGVYWSLYVELRFYLLVTVVLCCRRIKSTESLLVVWFLCLGCLEVFPSDRLRQLLIADYAAYFMAGATFFYIWRDGPTPIRVALIVAALGLALVEANRFVLLFESHYRTGVSLLATDLIIVGMFAAVGCISMSWTGPFANRTWFLAGAVTYPFYLIHQNIGYLVFNALSNRVNTHVLFWGTLATVLTASYCIVVFVDRPLRPRVRAETLKLLEKFSYSPQGRPRGPDNR